MKKIALFGGSFDPVHTDHVNIIKSCYENLKFDEVWVIPAYVNPFKNPSSSSVNQRLKMLEMAIKDLPYARISKYEISRQTSSFTYETVKRFQEKYPNFSFSFIMGSDQLDLFESWNNFSELIAMIDFKVFLRENTYNAKVVKKYNLETFNFENNHLSSTDIRNLLKLSLQIKSVNNYINQNLMYLYERLETKLDEKRYFHSLNVGQMALELAALNGVDLNKALIAGTLHDICKTWDQDKMAAYFKKYDPSLINEPKPVWHSFVGAWHLRYDWLFDDEEIISAIFKHTTASVDMTPLEMIVFCADKISIEREYPKVDFYRQLVKSDLKLGFVELLSQQVKNAIKKNGKEKVGSKILEAYEYWSKEVDSYD